jgi:drug/metabolite transporter (DMT)-like permease
MKVISIVFALLSSIAYGYGDFYAGSAARRAGPLTVTLLSSCVGLASAGAAALLYPSSVVSGDLLYGAAAGVCGTVGFLLFYAALERGAMGIAAAATSITADSVPVLVGLLQGDHLRSTQGVGIGLALFAGMLISVNDEDEKGPKISLSVVQAACGGCGFGASLSLFAAARPQAGLWPTFTGACVSVMLLGFIAFFTRASLASAKNVLGMCVLAGGFSMAGLVLFLVSRFTGILSIAAVLSSLSPIVVVLLSRVFLGERLRFRRLAGIAAAMVAVVLIAR